MAPPFRADHIGSLLRPKSLLDTRAELSSPTLLYTLTIPESVKEAETKAIRELVKQELENNVRPITDGEYGRHIFCGGFFEQLDGMEIRTHLPNPEAFRTDFPTMVKLLKEMGEKECPAVVSMGKIKYSRSPYLAEWTRLRDLLPQDKRAWGKVTIPSPTLQHIQLKVGTAWTPGSGYTTDREYFADLTACYRSELKTLYDAGLRNVQIDDPYLIYFSSDQFLGGCRKDGTDTDELLELYLWAHNEVLRDKPADLRAGVHLCRGNMSGSKHWAEGKCSYENIARKLLQETAYETFYLEFDDLDRTGGFEPLRFLPRGKNVVLGLISTKTPEMEDKGELKRKIMEVAGVLAEAWGVEVGEALGSLGVSPQCGFSSYSLAGGTGMTMDKMWEKLRLVRDVAVDVWGSA